MTTIVFFNNKGGVGKTTLVYHFSYMLSELGYMVLAVDLDPQSNLTSMFLTQERLEEIFSMQENRPTILKAINPILTGTGDIAKGEIEKITDCLGLICGDLELSVFEDELSENWGKCMDRKEAAFRVISSFYRIIKESASSQNADFVIVDVGPNLGALNRAIMIAADYVIIPMTADLFSLQGLKNLGSTLKEWRIQWKTRWGGNLNRELIIPEGTMEPIGYIVMQHGIRETRPVKSYLKWANKIPGAYRQYVLEADKKEEISVESDPYQLAMLKHYHSLAPLAMEAHKPMFLLKPADGIIGGHVEAVRNVYEDFKNLTEAVFKKLPDSIIQNKNLII
ncbi:MAG: AAA family ATPase [Bacteroidetes bacterium]|nr:AAA family ATPase [Bacteroidota bacterium]